MAREFYAESENRKLEKKRKHEIKPHKWQEAKLLSHLTFEYSTNAVVECMRVYDSLCRLYGCFWIILFMLMLVLEMNVVCLPSCESLEFACKCLYCAIPQSPSRTCLSLSNFLFLLLSSLLFFLNWNFLEDFISFNATIPTSSSHSFLESLYGHDTFKLLTCVWHTEMEMDSRVWNWGWETVSEG